MAMQAVPGVYECGPELMKQLSKPPDKLKLVTGEAVTIPYEESEERLSMDNFLFWSANRCGASRDTFII
eukprot:1565439-Pleurochrysis_carterae.AAC.2